MAKQLSTTTKLKLEDFFPQKLSELQRNYYKNLVKSSGLLHAVQKIIFEEWAPNVQQSVLQNCLEGKGDADKFTSLLYYNLNVEDHLNYTRNHIENVKTAYHCFNNVMSKHIKESVGVKREEEDATEDQINRHDESKFSLFECVTYAAKFFKKEKELEVSERYWQYGCHHHYVHNQHHPEYFEQGMSMPWRFLTEAIYDMAAMQLDKTYDNVLPTPCYKLLYIPDEFLTRFQRTGQYEVVKDVLSKTINYMKQNPKSDIIDGTMV